MNESIKELREKLQNVGLKEYRFLHPERKVSIYITKPLLKTSITANQVTYMDIMIGLVGIGFLFFGGDLYPFIGSLFLGIFVILDCVDGEIARYNKSTTPHSEFIEFIAHPIIHPLIYIGLSYGLYKTFENILVFIMGFSMMFVTFFNPLIDMKRESLLAKSSDHERTYKKIKASVEEKLEYLPFGGSITNIAAYIFSDVGIITVLIIFSGIDLLRIIIFPNGLFPFNINFKYFFLVFYGITLPILSVLNVVTSIRILKNEYVLT
jgi:phosphatidylglycerophosphate synthase